MESRSTIQTRWLRIEAGRRDDDLSDKDACQEVMKEIARKLAELETRTSSERGQYALFALFLRESSPEVWDLLVSAPWISRDKDSGLQYLAEQVKLTLKPEELTKLSRIVIIEVDNPGLEAVQKAINVQHALAEVIKSVFFGLNIEHAFIITSQRVPES